MAYTYEQVRDRFIEAQAKLDQVTRLITDWRLSADANDYDGIGDISSTYRSCAEQLSKIIGTIG